MAIHADWLDWMFEQRTDVWIAERTGIPRSTVGFVRRGERELGSAYYGPLRSAYQSETTRRLDEAGLPHREAIRFSMSRPERQREITNTMHSIIQDLAIGSTTNQYEASGEDPDIFDWNDTYEGYFDQIRDSIHGAPYTYDLIKERYGVET